MLTVYLDSSDFSNISRALSDPSWDQAAEWLSIYNDIVRSKKHGVAEFFFSHIHVSEIIHRAVAHREFSIGRAKVIRDICGDNSLRFSTEVFALEARALADGKTLSRMDYARTNGRWFPDLGTIKGNFRAQLTEVFKTALKQKAVSRKQRQMLESQAFRPDGTIRSRHSYVGLEAAVQQATAAICREWLISDRIHQENLLFRCLIGELPESQLDQEMVASLSDISRFVEKYYDLISDPEPLADWARGFGQSLETAIRPFQKQIADTQSRLGTDMTRKIYEEIFDKKGGKTLLENVRRTLISALRKADISEFKLFRISERDWEKFVANSQFGRLSSMDTMLMAAVKHLRMMTLPGENMRRPKVSDGGDILHMCYIPFVDVFRCDGYAGQIAENLDGKFSTRIAPNIKALMDMLHC